MLMILGWLFAFAFLLGFLALAIWLKRRRNERLPFPENIKLLRGPAETSRALLKDWEVNLTLRVLGISIIPFAGAVFIVAASTSMKGIGWAICCAAAFVVTALLSWWQVSVALKKLTEMTNRYLGHFGERVVAEAIDPLKAEGYRIFHDVPCDGKYGNFNIDHVMVGPAGVFAIETKTRRKGRSRDGFAAHEIIYDGTVLAYPWGEDRHGLEQAVRQAQWLEEWLETVVGKRPFVQPILTFPGWMVITRRRGPVAVLNPKMIVTLLKENPSAVLDPREIDLISRQLEARCRDVTFS